MSEESEANLRERCQRMERQNDLLTKALEIIADPVNYGASPYAIPVKVSAIAQAVLAELEEAQP